MKTRKTFRFIALLAVSALLLGAFGVLGAR